MKSYNHLWERLISDENIILAIHNASHGNMKRSKLTKIKNNPIDYIPIVRSWIENYKTIKHIPKTINDGISAKKREIIVPTVEEHNVSFRQLRKIVSKYDKERMVINLAQNF